jgi:hypothetical protein
MSKTLDIDKVLAEKFINKYGFAFDMFLLFRPYDKVKMSDIRKAFGGIVASGNFKIERQCDVEEFVKNSYSVYMRRFARVPRSMLYTHYKSVYGSMVDEAHKAFLTDRPINIEDEVMVEVKGGVVDVDSLSAPGYVSIMKVKVKEDITAIKVIYNSQLHRVFWPDMVNINLYVGTVLTSVYDTEGIYGRSTSLSIRSETLFKVAKGQLKETIAEKGVLQNDLRNYGLDINTVLDICDSEVSALNAPLEMATIHDVLTTQCKETETIDSLPDLIRNLENVIIPSVKENGSLPTYAEAFKYSKSFIKDRSKGKLGEISPKDSAVESEIDAYAASLAQSVLAYIRYSTLLNIVPNCEMEYLVLGLIDKSIKPVS